MAVIEYDEYKQKLQALEPTLGELEKALGIPKAREELAELQKETEQEGFWNDLERSQQVEPAGEAPGEQDQEARQAGFVSGRTP